MSTIPASAPVDSPPADTERPVLMYEFAPFQLDPIGRHLLKDGEVIPLTAKVFETLLALVRNHDRPVTKEDLISAVWPGTFVSDDSLVQNISAIRKTLGDDPSQPRYIVTLARRGYRFIAPTVEHTDLDTTTALSHKSDSAGGTSALAPVRPASLLEQWTPRWSIVAGALLVALSATGIFAVLLARGPSDEGSASTVLFREHIPAGQSLRGGAAISPDGRQIAFATQDNKGFRIWIRQLDSPDATALPGTEDGTLPFWSPDGKFLGFVTSGVLRRLELATGSVRAIATVHRIRPLGVSWGAGDTILFGDLGKIFAVPATGGTPTVVAGSGFGKSDAAGELRWPQMLDDGTHFIFFASGNTPEESGTFLGKLGSQEQVRLAVGSRATFASPNHLLYVRDNALMSQTFDVATGQLLGPPMTIPGSASPRTTFSASANGVLAISELTASQRLVWLDRTGHAVGSIDNAFESVNAPKELADLTLSPNGERALIATLEAGTYELWLVDLIRSVSTKLLTNATFPAWAPDGERFAYTHMSADGADVYVRPVSGAQATPWFQTKELKAVTGWSPDGKHIVFSRYRTLDQTSTDVWLLPTTGERKPVAFLETKARERGGPISPDGRWLAYTSNETGTAEVYVTSFPTPSTPVRISTLGGNQPLWRRDGRELFYVASDHRVMSVSVTTGQDFRPMTPKPLFSLPFVASSISRQVDVTADGQRFLVVDGASSGHEARINLLTNWTAARRP